eukprot:gene18096-24523_t
MKMIDVVEQLRQAHAEYWGLVLPLKVEEDQGAASVNASGAENPDAAGSSTTAAEDQDAASVNDSRAEDQCAASSCSSQSEGKAWKREDMSVVLSAVLDAGEVLSTNGLYRADEGHLVSRLAALYPEYALAIMPADQLGDGGVDEDDEEPQPLSSFVGNAVMEGDPCMYHVDADPAQVPSCSPWVHNHGYYHNSFVLCQTRLTTTISGGSLGSVACGDHQRAGKPLFVSMLVYLNEEWKEEWNSETMFLDPESACGLFVRPQPGRNGPGTRNPAARHQPPPGQPSPGTSDQPARSHPGAQPQHPGRPRKQQTGRPGSRGGPTRTPKHPGTAPPGTHAPQAPGSPAPQANYGPRSPYTQSPRPPQPIPRTPCSPAAFTLQPSPHTLHPSIPSPSPQMVLMGQDVPYRLLDGVDGSSCAKVVATLIGCQRLSALFPVGN